MKLLLRTDNSNHPTRLLKTYHLWFMVSVVVYLIFVLLYRSFTMEDAYISFRYAENFASGLGVVFNAGQPVEGYTDFLWVILLAFAHRLGGDTLVIAKALGVIAGILTLAVVAWTSRRIHPASNWSGAVALLLLAVYPGFAIWSVAGLETTLFTFLVTLGFALFLFDSDSNTSWAALVFGLAALTRPEGILFFAIAFGVQFVVRWQRQSSIRKALSTGMIWSAPFVVIVVIWEIWRWSYYGYPLPNTFYLKVATDQLGTAPITQGFGYMTDFWNSIGGWFVLGFSLLLLFSKSPVYWKIYFPTVIAAWLIYLRFVNGDWMPWYRFFIPVLPLVFLALEDALVFVGEKSTDIKMLLVGMTIIGSALFALYTFRVETVRLNGYGLDAVAAGKWLGEHTERRSTIAVTNAGAIPYYSQLRTIDYFGLMNTTISHSPLREYKLDLGDGNSQSTWLRLDVDWLFDQHPDLIEIPGTLRNGKLVTYAPLAELIYSSPRFVMEFESAPIFVQGTEMIFNSKHTSGAQ